MTWERAIDSLPDAVVSVDGANRVTYLNAAAEVLLGWASHELVGRSINRILPADLHEVDGRPLLEHLLARMPALDGRPAKARALRKGGVAIEVGFTVWASTQRDGSAAVIALLRRLPESVDFAVDELTPVTGEENESERTYRLVFDNAPFGIFHFDGRGVLTACNERFVRMIGSSKRVLIGLRMLTLPDPRIVSCVREAISGRRAHYAGDYRSTTADKTTPVRADFNPIFASDGRVVGGVGIVEDVTERRQAERVLAHADRMASLGALAAGVAHEINNPLSFVSANLELALRHLPAAEGTPGESAQPSSLASARRAIEEAQSGARRVQRLVRDLRTFGRAGEDRRDRIDVRKCIDTAIELGANDLRHRVTLIREYEELRPVWGSETRLVQVFVNLLVNAAQALPDPDPNRHRITVRTKMSENPSQVIVEIEDTGAGIHPAFQSRIFDPFYSSKADGMGLGLSICHGIVTALGGDIEVHSKVGQGSTFTVRLPPAEGVTGEEATPTTQEVAERAPQLEVTEPTGRARVLVVDDEQRLAETFRLALKDAYDVSIAHSGNAALDAILNEPPFDVILCDMMVPDLPGPDIYRRVVAERPQMAERFVFMTGGAFTEAAREFLQQVENPRLEKPFPLAEVDRLIRARWNENRSNRGA